MKTIELTDKEQYIIVSQGHDEWLEVDETLIEVDDHGTSSVKVIMLHEPSGVHYAFYAERPRDGGFHDWFPSNKIDAVEHVEVITKKWRKIK